MKTFKEILFEHWRKSPGYKSEYEADFKKDVLENPDFTPVLNAVEEYAAQFKSSTQEIKPDPAQVPLFHHPV